MRCATASGIIQQRQRQRQRQMATLQSPAWRMENKMLMPATAQAQSNRRHHLTLRPDDIEVKEGSKRESVLRHVLLIKCGRKEQTSNEDVQLPNQVLWGNPLETCNLEHQEGYHVNTSESNKAVELAVPCQNDVLFGEGCSITNHFGNRRFRSLVELLQQRCLQSKVEDIAKIIVKSIHEAGGRFLKEATNDSRMNNLGSSINNHGQTNPTRRDGIVTDSFILGKEWVHEKNDSVMQKVMHLLDEKRVQSDTHGASTNIPMNFGNAGNNYNSMNADDHNSSHPSGQTPRAEQIQSISSSMKPFNNATASPHLGITRQGQTASNMNLAFNPDGVLSERITTQQHSLSKQPMHSKRASDLSHEHSLFATTKTEEGNDTRHISRNREGSALSEYAPSYNINTSCGRPNLPAASQMPAINNGHPQIQAAFDRRHINNSMVLNYTVPRLANYPAFHPLPAFPAHHWAYNVAAPYFPQMMPTMIAPVHNMATFPGSHLSCEKRPQPPSNEGALTVSHHTTSNMTVSHNTSSNPQPSNSLRAPLATPMATSHEPTSNPPSISREYCGHNLRPAEIPHDPLDDEWENSTLLEKEIAWLVEESDIFLPSSENNTTPESKLWVPIALEFAWRHGSLQLRELMWDTFPSKIGVMATNLNRMDHKESSRTFVNGMDLIQSSHRREALDGLRKEARKALQWGFRRSESTEKELNVFYGFRWRQAVEEVGKPGDVTPCGISELRQPRHRRKRHKNAALLQIALGKHHSSSSKSPSDTEAETIASKVPSELTHIEDEVAWLVEESLILLPDDMIDKKSAISSNQKDLKRTESVVSAGLVTKSEINWDYVTTNASELLKENLNRIGGIKRRPLQRLIRMSRHEVNAAFQKRRVEIASLLLIKGYRRNETKHALPSHELLVQTGLHKVWAVKLMRRRQNEKHDDLASSEDLRSACNARLGDKESSQVAGSMLSKKRKIVNPKQSPQKILKDAAGAATLAIPQKKQPSILTTEEEEIAWLREEYAFETGNAFYDWDYIEQMSSLSLLISLAERRCAPSSFPSDAGISKLQIMVRLSNPSVKTAFEQKRRDVRYAITQKGFRRDRKKSLPDIPSAPSSSSPRKNGTSVVDIEYAPSKHDVENEITCLDESSDGEVAQDQSGMSDSSHDINGLKCSGYSAAAVNEKREESNMASEKTSPLPDDGRDHGKDDCGKKREDENASVTKSHSSEYFTSDEESESEAVDEEDDEYEVSSDEMSDEDDMIEDSI